MGIIIFLRQFRIGGFAIFDFATAFLGILIISPLLSKIFHKLGFAVPKKNWLFLTLPIGIVVHLLIGRTTPLTSEFLDVNNHYLVKIVVVGLFVLGLHGIKRIKK